LVISTIPIACDKEVETRRVDNTHYTHYTPYHSFQWRFRDRDPREITTRVENSVIKLVCSQTSRQESPTHIRAPRLLAENLALLSKLGNSFFLLNRPASHRRIASHPTRPQNNRPSRVSPAHTARFGGLFGKHRIGVVPWRRRGFLAWRRFFDGSWSASSQLALLSVCGIE
jgi:hypothetical protein